MNRLHTILIGFEVPYLDEGFGKDSFQFTQLLNNIYKAYTKPLLVTDAKINLIELRNLRYLVVFQSIGYIDLALPTSRIESILNAVKSNISAAFDHYFSELEIPYKQI